MRNRHVPGEPRGRTFRRGRTTIGRTFRPRPLRFGIDLLDGLVIDRSKSSRRVIVLIPGVLPEPLELPRNQFPTEEELAKQPHLVAEIVRTEIWLFRGNAIRVRGGWLKSPSEKVLAIINTVLKREDRVRRLAHKLLPDNRATSARKRSVIPDDVRIFVWRRDEGKCTRCGSNERLEFDHIIPLASGGSSTARNLQLLCEACNRSKGVHI